MAWLGMVKVNRVMAETTKTAVALTRRPVLRTEVVFMMIEALKEAIMGRTSDSLCAVANTRALHQVNLIQMRADGLMLPNGSVIKISKIVAERKLSFMVAARTPVCSANLQGSRP